jgi:hypothetical protein
MPLRIIVVVAVLRADVLYQALKQESAALMRHTLTFA